MEQNDILNRIHHINPKLNRWLSWPLFFVSFIVVLLILILPYRGRALLALFINLVFNRPIIYLNYLARYITKPLAEIQMAVFYFLIVGPYALIHRSRSGKRTKGWVPASATQNEDDFRFRS